jgi:hypothetical protein
MKQMTIVMPDRAGLVAEITETLAAERINIETFDAEEVAGIAVVRLSVDEYDKALQALVRRGIQPVTEDAILVRIEDKPGALAAVAKRFRDAALNMRSLRIIHAANGQTLAAIATERTAEALALVQDILIA